LTSRIVGTTAGLLFASRVGMPEKSKPENSELPVSPPFCSDPNCPYCKELREIEEELNWQNGKTRKKA